MKTKHTAVAVAAAVERLESLAADALEELIEDTEEKANIKVKDVAVEVIPDAQGASPAVVVTVDVSR